MSTKTLAPARLDFKLATRIATNVTKYTGVSVSVIDDLHSGIYYEVDLEVPVIDFWYAKGYLHALEQTMVDMFQ